MPWYSEASLLLTYDVGLILIYEFKNLGNMGKIVFQGKDRLKPAVAERLKFQEYKSTYSHNYFWRTYDQKEIDWLEDREGILFAYEFKYKDKKVKCPKSFKEAYPDSVFTCITSENYLDFIT